MRPSDITDGILGQITLKVYRGSTLIRFNEAVGYYRRNPADGAALRKLHP